MAEVPGQATTSYRSFTTFKYRPLENAKSQFRLLQIGQEAQDQTTLCSLHVFDLADAPPYTAISYTWGPPEPLQEIELDGASFQVRRNCYYALQQAAHCRPSGYIWVDSICIDQENSLEKSLQVWRMGDIYAQAEEVSVSLGEHEDDSSFVCDTLRQLQALPLDAVQGTRAAELRYLVWAKDLKTSEDLERLLAAYRHLARRPYWSRVWIVQEVALARKVSIWCDIDVLDLRALRDLSAAFRSMSDEISVDDADDSMDPLWLSDMQQARVFEPKDEYDPDRMNARDICGMFSRRGCTDLRDRVYGALRLMPWSPRSRAPVPNYQCSVWEVALDAIRHLDDRRTETDSSKPVALQDLLADVIAILDMMKVSSADECSGPRAARHEWASPVKNDDVSSRAEGLYTAMSSAQLTAVTNITAIFAEDDQRRLTLCTRKRTSNDNPPPSDEAFDAILQRPAEVPDGIQTIYADCDALGFGRGILRGDTIAITQDHTHWNASKRTCGMVLRHSSVGAYEIVGLAIFKAWFASERGGLECACDPATSGHHVAGSDFKICLDAEDLMRFACIARTKEDLVESRVLLDSLSTGWKRTRFSSFAVPLAQRHHQL